MTGEKSPETKFLQRAITQLKAGQTWKNLNLPCIMWRQIHIWNFKSLCRKMTKKSPENEILAKGNNSCLDGQMQPKSNLTCIKSRQIHIRNFKSISRKMTKKSPENEILAKGNNSCKSRSKASKVKLDLYYIKTNSYTKFQVNITKDWREKFGKLNFYKGQ